MMSRGVIMRARPRTVNMRGDQCEALHQHDRGIFRDSLACTARRPSIDRVQRHEAWGPDVKRSARIHGARVRVHVRLSRTPVLEPGASWNLSLSRNRKKEGPSEESMSEFCHALERGQATRRVASSGRSSFFERLRGLSDASPYSTVMSPSASGVAR